MSSGIKNVALPVAAIIAAATAMVGGFSYAVKCTVDAHRDYDNIADDYVLIRSYGTKM